MPMLYAPGTTPVAVTPRGFAALESGASAALLARIRSLLADGRGLGGVIEALTGAYGASLTAIPGFAVALAEDDGLRVAVRGEFVFGIEGTSPESVSGAGVTTWTERVIPGVVRVTLTTSEGSAPAEFEIVDGIVLAAGIEWDAAAPGAAAAGRSSAGDAVPAAAPAPPATPAVAPAGEPPVRGPWSSRVAAPDAAAPAPASVIDSSDVASVADAEADAETLLPLDSALAPPAATDDVVPPDDPAPAGPEDEFASTTGYDHLWGATVIRSVEEAAVRPEGEDEEGAPAPSSVPADGDHDGATISLAQARALREAAATAEAAGPPAAPGAVDASIALGGAGAGHPPIDSVPAPLAPPRPPAPGRVRLSTGQVLPLDRTVVIGRRPRSTRVSGTDLPHLVAVDSPQQDISRSHVELRVEGESIVATDLRTTNGTTLLRPGTDPVRLHPGEGTVVVAGDVLDLGDGVTVAIEALS